MTEAKYWAGTTKADRFLFSSDDDRFDFVKAGRGNDFISDGDDDGIWSTDAFYGQKGKDTLVSHDGNDFLHGGRGADTIEVFVNWYDPAEIPGGGGTVVDNDILGFDVRVFGGRGYDVLKIRDSDGYSVEQRGETTIIHTRYDGTITAHGIEEILFL